MTCHRNLGSTKLAVFLLAWFMLSPLNIPKLHAQPSDAQLCAAIMSGIGSGLGGYRLRAVDTDALREGEAMDYTMTLFRHRDYLILACGDDTVRDLDLHIYDDDGRLIAQDRETDATPVLNATLRWTAGVKVRVEMYDSVNGRRGFYTLAILHR